MRSHLNNTDVTGNDVAGLDFLLLAVPNDGGLEGNAGLELFDNITSGLFLIPTNEGVLKEKRGGVCQRAVFWWRGTGQAQHTSINMPI